MISCNPIWLMVRARAQMRNPPSPQERWCERKSSWFDAWFRIRWCAVAWTKRALRKCIRAHIDFIRMWFIEISLANKKYIFTCAEFIYLFSFAYKLLSNEIDRMCARVCAAGDVCNDSHIKYIFGRNWNLLLLHETLLTYTYTYTHKHIYIVRHLSATK